jgi:predicted transcriptional regulator of viral defense system
LAKLAGNGELLRIATGYYIVVPRANQDRPWVPQLEAVAAGIGAADFGQDSAILMGVSAARLHGAIPRSLATAMVAAPRQRRRVRLLDRPADVVFVKRDTTRLDAVRTATELGAALITSIEQTILDIAHRPELGDAEEYALESLDVLLPRADPDRLKDLARKQRLMAGLTRVLSVAER